MAARVVLAMSGGVDSSAAALLLKRQGYDVVGVFMRSGVEQPDDACDTRKRGCCSAVDAADARRVADRLDIPFYALNFEEEFGRIMDYFTDEYLAGRTPNPCVVCNNWLKFGKLWSYGKQMDADFIATGHYARIINRDGETELHRGRDLSKDQSYVLAGLRKSLLPKMLFPVGDMQKTEIRQLAEETGLNVFDKPDSVEICFVPDNDHAAFIQRHRPGTDTAGNIVDTSGSVRAQHDGIENFTIGQRKGLGFGSSRRRYVLQIVPSDNSVVIGDREELLAEGLLAKRVNWFVDPNGQSTSRCTVKIRYRHDPTPATVSPIGPSEVNIQFDQPQSAVTPGQMVVFYQGDRVLGGGWIDSAI